MSWTISSMWRSTPTIPISCSRSGCVTGEWKHGWLMLRVRPGEDSRLLLTFQWLPSTGCVCVCVSARAWERRRETDRQRVRERLHLCICISKCLYTCISIVHDICCQHHPTPSPFKASYCAYSVTINIIICIRHQENCTESFPTSISLIDVRQREYWIILCCAIQRQIETPHTGAEVLCWVDGHHDATLKTQHASLSHK